MGAVNHPKKDNLASRQKTERGSAHPVDVSADGPSALDRFVVRTRDESVSKAFAFGTLLERIRSEYLEMPGLCLTIEQAQRLFCIERVACQEVLDALIGMKFLCLTATGRYARLSSGADVLRRLHSVRTSQLKVQLERRQLLNRRLAPRGGRRATDVGACV